MSVLDPAVILPNPSASAPVSASLTTALTGSNNDLTWTWLYPGTAGNGKTVEYTISGAYSVVTVATVGSVSGVLVTGPVGTTARQVWTAARANSALMAVMDVTIAPSNDGTGAVITLASTPMAGGAGTVAGAPATVLP